MNPYTRAKAALLLAALCLCLFAPARPGVAAAEESPGIGLLDAVHQTLSGNESIKLQQEQVEIGKGLLQAATGRFDLTFQASLTHDRDNSPLAEANRAASGLNDITTKTTTSQDSLGRAFRNGASAGIGVAVTQTESISIGPEPTNRARVYFQLKQPLLKGRGIDAAGAGEKAYRLSLEADRLDLAHVVAGSIRDTALAYWRYLAASENLRILKESEERAHRLVRETRVLIEADERPASDLIQLEANLAEKLASRINAQQGLVDAKYALGLVMGLPPEDMEALAPPENSFSTFDVSLLPSLADSAPLLARALESRSDLLASMKHEEAARVLVLSARNGLLPGLDLTFETGYSGLDEGNDPEPFLSSLGSNPAGLNVTAGISLTLPVQNNTARGELFQQEAQRRQQAIRTRDLTRQISSGIAVEVSALISSAAQLAKARESADYYRRTIANEEQKLRLGMSTLIDVVTFEDRLTGALVNVVGRNLQFAESVARLRFATGTLVSVDLEAPEKSSIGMEELTRVPVVEH
ncbi:MAG: TolC family protein [Pseudomonadota bacterium]